jgi:hypothetical protein
MKYLKYKVIIRNLLFLNYYINKIIIYKSLLIMFNLINKSNYILIKIQIINIL